jgi:hypothetical protein
MAHIRSDCRFFAEVARHFLALSAQYGQIIKQVTIYGCHFGTGGYWHRRVKYLLG